MHADPPGTGAEPFRPSPFDSTDPSEAQKSKAIFYNSRAGLLYVRATEKDQEKIEEVLYALQGGTPPLINIEVKWIEVSGENETEVDWPRRVALTNALEWRDGSGLWPPVQTAFREGQGPNAGAEATRQHVLTNLIPALLWRDGPLAGATNARIETQFAGQMAILTESETAMLMSNATNFGPNTAVFASPKVTTVSGREAQIQSVESKTVMLSSAPGGSVVFPVPDTELRPRPYLALIGPTLDVSPVVKTDERTIDRAVTMHLNQFVGYDESPPGPVAVAIPRFRAHRARTCLDIDDGQSLLLAFPPTRQMVAAPKRLLNRLGLSRDKRPTEQWKRVYVVITAEQIGPAGNLVRQFRAP